MNYSTNAPRAFLPIIVCLSFFSLASADIWTGTTTFKHDFSVHRQAFHDQLRLQMRRPLARYIDENKNIPAVKRIIGDDSEKLFAILDSEIENITLRGLGEFSMQVNASARAVPTDDSFLVENINVECGQSVGFNGTWDPEPAGFPIGIGKWQALRLDFEDVKVAGNNKSIALISGTGTEIEAKVKARFFRSLTYCFPHVDGDGFKLTPITLESETELPKTGRSEVVVALIGKEIHIRIFNAEGGLVSDKGESELGESVSLKSMRNLFDSAMKEKVRTFEAAYTRRAIALSSDYKVTITGEAVAPIDGNFKIAISDN